MWRNALLSLLFCAASCEHRESNDEVERKQQEQISSEGSKAVGMPAIKNFRQRKAMKMIQELLDEDGVITYTYLENMTPVKVPGVTALGGKLTFFGQTINYPQPYATQFTNPMKISESRTNVGYAILPQADPDGLYKPSSAEATWVLVANPEGGGAVKPVYVEPKIITLPYKLPFD